MKKEFYTSGELAKLTGVSYKTIRHYNAIGLLTPEYLGDNGYRYYGTNSIELLQRILMLKYLNFSLDEIKNLIVEDSSSDDIFLKQEKLLLAQQQHLSEVISAVKAIQKIDRSNRLDQIIHIINMTRQKEEIIKQYMESDNLEKRINIHMYSTSSINWYQWIYDGLKLEEGMKILEIGAGNGMLWLNIIEQLPKNLTITLTDRSINMLETAKKYINQRKNILQEKNITFYYEVLDAEVILSIYKEQAKEDRYDRVIANHMLYHISNEQRPALLRRCKELLREGGMFYASTVGKYHNEELFNLVREFDERIQIPSWISENFQLENGGEQLEEVFTKVTKMEHENNLLVPEPLAIYHYLLSLPGNAKDMILERNEEMLAYLEKKVSKETPYFIRKSTGAFIAYK